MHTYTRTHTHSPVDLVWNWGFLPTQCQKKLNKVIQIRDIKHITFGSPLCQQGLLWGWTSTHLAGPRLNKHCDAVLPSPGISENCSPTVIISEAGQDGTSLLPYPWCHWIGEGETARKAVSWVPVSPCSIKACQPSIFPSFFFFLQDRPTGEKR